MYSTWQFCRTTASITVGQSRHIMLQVMVCSMLHQNLKPPKAGYILTPVLVCVCVRENMNVYSVCHTRSLVYIFES